MSLLKKALRYRREYLNKKNKKSGLLNRTLEYLGFKKLDDKDIVLGSTFTEDKNEKLIDAEIKKNDNKIIEYYTIVDEISEMISNLSYNKNILDHINDIITDKFSFSKNILFVFSPVKQKFVYWTGRNINNDAVESIGFDLQYQNIYKKIIQKRHLLNKKNNKLYKEFSKKISNIDGDFQLFIPFIFCGRVIAIYLGLELKNNKLPDNDLIKSVEIVGRLNGALLYNVLQQQSIFN